MRYNKESTSSIQALFNAIAPYYDRTNGQLSFQLHRLWNRRLAKVFLNLSSTTHLDLCAGTGDIAFRLLKQSQKPMTAYLLDFSSNMLSLARKRAEQLRFPYPHAIHYVEADATATPFENSSVDSISMAYGLRNIRDVPAALRESHRLLRAGGTVAFLELTRPQGSLLRWCHTAYLNYGIPLISWATTPNDEAYSYLKESIQAFCSPEEIADQLKACSFQEVRVKRLCGGIATLIIAKKTAAHKPERTTPCSCKKTICQE